MSNELKSFQAGLQSNEPEKVIENLMYGFMASSVLFVGDELGVLDYIARQDVASLSDIAVKTETDESALERLLIASCSVGLLKKQDKSFYYVPEPLKKLLLKDSANYCGASFGHYFKTTAPLFQFLPDAIKQNRTQWHQLFPEKGDNVDPFEAVYASEEETRIFLESMWGLGYSDSKDLVNKFDMSRFDHLVDLGGATGSFVVSALEKNETMTGSVFDFSLVEPFFSAKRSQHQLTDRLSFVAGDIFKDQFPQADCYSLGYILSDWDREKGTDLLKKIYDSLPSGGAVVILEKLFNDQKDGPLPTSMMNLVMLLEMEGTHYSVPEYKVWLREIGFEGLTSYYSTGEKHMVVGFKP